MDIPVALAGAMGGSSTEVDGTTTRILLESATFNLYNLRNTQMRHGIFSEAITRFTKGQPAALTSATLARAVDMLTSSTGARVASAVADAYPAPLKQVVVTLPVERITATLGLELPTEDIATILENAEFGVAVADDILTVAVPVWRADIHIPEDIIEEVGRLYGFDEIAPTLPQRAFAAVAPSAFDALKQQIRQTLVRAGANEVLTYSFVHGDVLQRAEQDTSKSYRITNSISPDLQYYRQSLTPSLLGLVRQNVKQGYGEFALFEVNKTHSKVNALVEDGVPAEAHRVGLVYAAKNTQPGAPYYRAKQLLEYLGASLGLELEYRSVPAGATMALLAPFEHRRSARIVDAKSGQAIGVVGEYKKSVARGFKLPEYAAGFELLTEGISLALKHATHIYTPISRYPSSERDICFQVEADVTYGAVLEAAKQVLAEIDLELDIAPLDIYAPEAGDTKNITVRLRLTSHERTLTGDDVSGVVAQVVEAVVAATSAKVI